MQLSKICNDKKPNIFGDTYSAFVTQRSAETIVTHTSTAYAVTISRTNRLKQKEKKNNECRFQTTVLSRNTSTVGFSYCSFFFVTHEHISFKLE